MKKEKLLEKIEQYKDEHGAKAAILDIVEPALESIKKHEMILSLTDRNNSGVLYMRLMDGEDRGDSNSGQCRYGILGGACTCHQCV